MKKFKIAFMNLDDDEVYSITKPFDDLAEAKKYASLILATTSDDCISFTIYEI